jgi:glutamate-1-semialdehyde 2,1-aminomutase
MELGGLRNNRERVFLLSTTHGAETPALAACLKTIETYREKKVIEYLWKQGEVLQQGLNQLSESMHLTDYFRVIGRPCNLVYMTRDQEKIPSQSFRALFLQETIKRGVLAPSLVLSFAHTDEDLQRTIEAVEGTLNIYKKALEGGVENYLVGRPVKPVFRRYN